MSIEQSERDTLTGPLTETEEKVCLLLRLGIRENNVHMYMARTDGRCSSVSIEGVYQSPMTFRRHVGHESFSYAREAVSIGEQRRLGFTYAQPG